MTARPRRHRLRNGDRRGGRGRLGGRDRRGNRRWRG